jgi:hypothetical protein
MRVAGNEMMDGGTVGVSGVRRQCCKACVVMETEFEMCREGNMGNKAGAVMWLH